LTQLGLREDRRCKRPMRISSGVRLVVLLAALSGTHAALTQQQREYLHGTWSGYARTMIVGIRISPEDIVEGGTPSSDETETDSTDPTTNTSVVPVLPTTIENFAPACLTFSVEVPVHMAFDTSTDTFAYHMEEYRAVYIGESAWIPAMTTTGKIVQWESGEITFESNEVEKQRCWAMREESVVNNSARLFVAVKNSFSGSELEQCPDRTTIRCTLDSDPPVFVLPMELLKKEGLEKMSIDNQMGWSSGIDSSACTHTGILPWDLLLPADCWTPAPEEEMPMWIYLVGVGTIIFLCCGCCISCCACCCRTFADEHIRDEDLPCCMRVMRRYCCCCFKWCFRGFNPSPHGDPEEEHSLTISTPNKRVIKIKPFRPQWAQKYGEHADAWRVAASIK